MVLEIYIRMRDVWKDTISMKMWGLLPGFLERIW